MKRLELKKILLILIGVVTITSCQKENLLDEQKTLSTVKQQKIMEGFPDEGVIPEEEYILYYIFEEGGFNVDNYASPIVFREHVEIDGVSYDIFITDDEAIMQNWKEEMLAQGKLVFVKFVNGVYIVVVRDIIIEFPEELQHHGINEQIARLLQQEIMEYVEVGGEIHNEGEIDNPETGICYGFIITADADRLERWKQQERDRGKQTYVIETSIAITSDISITVYIGFSYEEE